MANISERRVRLKPTIITCNLYVKTICMPLIDNLVYRDYLYIIDSIIDGIPIYLYGSLYLNTSRPALY